MKIWTGSAMLDLTNPDPGHIKLEEIFRGLALRNRWGAAATRPCSVLEHSIRVADRVPPHLALSALLHDAAEAYLGDVPAPAKALMPDYRAIEERLQGVIDFKYDLVRHKLIVEADRADREEEARRGYYKPW